MLTFPHHPRPPMYGSPFSNAQLMILFSQGGEFLLGVGNCSRKRENWVRSLRSDWGAVVGVDGICRSEGVNVLRTTPVVLLDKPGWLCLVPHDKISSTVIYSMWLGGTCFLHNQPTVMACSM